MSRPASALVLAAALTVLAACENAPPAASEPALACQTRPCRCFEPATGLFSKRKEADIQWRDNGDAYCPDGFVLTVVPRAPLRP